MVDPYTSNALLFLITTLLGLYEIILLLRFTLQWVRADFRNPVSMLIVKLTQPLLRPIRRIVPGIGGLDISSLLLLFMVLLLEWWCYFFFSERVASGSAIMLLSIASMLNMFVYMFVIAIIIIVVVSWVNPGAYHPLLAIVYAISNKVLIPVRRYMPNMQGLDLSPMIATILLIFFDKLVIERLKGFAISIL